MIVVFVKSTYLNVNLNLFLYRFSQKHADFLWLFCKIRDSQNLTA